MTGTVGSNRSNLGRHVPHRCSDWKLGAAPHRSVSIQAASSATGTPVNSSNIQRCEEAMKSIAIAALLAFVTFGQYTVAKTYWETLHETAPRSSFDERVFGPHEKP